MARIEETDLPGVGVRYDFETSDGRRVGVVHHHGGRREMFVCPIDDPDAVDVKVDLSEDDAHTLVDTLGVSTIVEKLTHLQQMVEGLALDWLSIGAESPYAGKTIGDARIRTRTGVSVVAVLRGDDPVPAPGPEFGIKAGDVLVVVGTPDGITTVNDILSNG